MTVLRELHRMLRKPEPFEHYTSPLLWNTDHFVPDMLAHHLNPASNEASHPKASIEEAVEWMTAHFGISDSTRVCDFGCGPGLWTTRFAEKGARTTGIDLSERSIRYARRVAEERKLAIHYVLQDYLKFSTDDRFDLITMIHGDFSVLSPEQRAKMLQTFHTLLSDSGAVMLEVASMKQFHEAEPKREYGFSPTPPTYPFSNRFTYEHECLIVDQYTIIDGDGERTIYTWNQCYTTDSLTELFEEHGFRIEGFYSDMSGAPLKQDSRVIALVAREAT